MAVRPRRHPADVWREATKTQNMKKRKLICDVLTGIPASKATEGSEGKPRALRVHCHSDSETHTHKHTRIFKTAISVIPVIVVNFQTVYVTLLFILQTLLWNFILFLLFFTYISVPFIAGVVSKSLGVSCNL